MDKGDGFDTIILCCRQSWMDWKWSMKRPINSYNRYILEIPAERLRLPYLNDSPLLVSFHFLF